MALVISLQRDPLAWTSAARPTANDAKPTVASQTVAKTAPNAGTASPAVRVLEIPEVRIETRISASQPAKRDAPESDTPESLEPCSEWHDIGPAYVDHGQPLGARRVRSLC
jgi:hypothetical protein